MQRFKFVLYRPVQLLPVLFGISLVTFVLVHALPGDPVRAFLGPKASAETVERIRGQFGLDRPVAVQYLYFLRNLTKGELGTSVIYKMPVGRLVFERIDVTAFLMISGVALTLLLTLPLAITAALHQGRWPDHLIRLFSTGGLGFPAFWLGIMLIIVLSVRLGLFPVSGYGEDALSHLHHLVLPALTIALALSAVLTRNLRASLIAELEADYVSAARAKGMPERWIFLRHVLPQLAHPDSQPPRRQPRLADRRYGDHRVGLLGAGSRLAPGDLDLHPRLHGRARCHANPRLRDRADQLRGRRSDRGARPEDRAVRVARSLAGISVPTGLGGRPGLGRVPVALVCGVGIVLFWALLALLADVVAPFDPDAYDYAAALAPPGAVHWLGTDNFGRDVLSRVIHGARIDLQMGIIGVICPFVLGTVIGSISGYFGGTVDTFLMRVVDVTIAFPFLVLMIAIIAVLEPGLTSFYIAVALVGWVSYARLVRSQVLVLKASEFVLAARSLGYGHLRIMFRHILPNALIPSTVFSMSDVVLVILAGSAISYLGLGVQPPTAEWGVMIAEGQNFMTTAWWITTFPGLAIVFLALGFSLLADGLGERLGVRE